MALGLSSAAGTAGDTDAADSGAGLADGAGLAGLAFAAALLADGADAFAAALLPDGADALGLDVTRGRFGAAGWAYAKEANGLSSKPIHTYAAQLIAACRGRPLQFLLS